MKDAILIRGLELEARVGVPDSEFAHPQRLELDADILPLNSFDSLGDDLSRTVDYDLACRRLRETAAASPRRLIETLASDLAETLLREFPAASATIVIRKFILPGVRHVAVRHTASKA